MNSSIGSTTIATSSHRSVANRHGFGCADALNTNSVANATQITAMLMSSAIASAGLARTCSLCRYSKRRTGRMRNANTTIGAANACSSRLNNSLPGFCQPIRGTQISPVRGSVSAMRHGGNSATRTARFSTGRRGFDRSRRITPHSASAMNTGQSTARPAYITSSSSGATVLVVARWISPARSNR
jgi:hypothetical protein